MFKPVDILKINIGNLSVGRMVLTDDRLCVFEYDKEFLEKGFSISPFYLPLKPGVHVAKREPFNGLFGIFNDSLPDGWGHLLIDRYLKSRGIKPETLSVLDRLSLIGSSGMGALVYSPDNHITSKQSTNDIVLLANEVNRILTESDYHTSLELLAEKGGSSGGARPKVLININDEPWLVKFPSSVDPPEIGEIEFNYSLIAKKCGIEMPETKLLEGKYFGVRRFDRKNGKRIHMHTASGLLYASHRYPSLDYIDLIKATLAVTKNIDDGYKLFRLMIFNVLTGNKDDHSRNFSFLYDDGRWRLAPAYDLVLSDGFNGYHSTTINGSGQPSKDDIFKVAETIGLKPDRINSIFDEVYENCREIKVRSIDP